MQETGFLTKWEPLHEQVYDRFRNPMYLYNIEFDGELKLTFGNEDNRYQFIYKRSEKFYYPIRMHRILQEHIRSDIEELIEQYVTDLKKKALPLPKYNNTFYKVKNSSFLAWFQSIDDSIPEFEVQALEHHLYISDDYIIDVLAVVQPVIIKI